MKAACQETMRFAYHSLINRSLDHTAAIQSLDSGQIQTCIQQVLENFPIGNVAR
jgi:hypothetical protein